MTDVYEDRAVVDKMVERYTAVDTDEARAKVVAELSDELGKTVQSIRSKLVREQVYIAKVRTSKDGSEVITKSVLVDMIAEKLGVEFTESEAMSLEKATKTTLKKILG